MAARSGLVAERSEEEDGADGGGQLCPQRTARRRLGVDLIFQPRSTSAGPAGGPAGAALAEPG